MLDWQLKNLKQLSKKVTTGEKLSKQELKEWEELNDLYTEENIYNQFVSNSLNNI